MTQLEALQVISEGLGTLLDSDRPIRCTIDSIDRSLEDTPDGMVLHLHITEDLADYGVSVDTEPDIVHSNFTVSIARSKGHV